MKKKLTSNHHDYLIKKLKNHKYALGYLNACLEDGDEGVFLLALHDVAEAQGGVQKLAKKAGLNREHLFRMLSPRGNPKLSNFQSVVSTLGWKISLSEKNHHYLRHAA